MGARRARRHGAPPLQLVLAVGGALVRGVVLALAPHVTASLFFMFTTQVSHIQEACQSDAVLNEPCPFKRQAQTSLDYSPSNSLVWFITGGLNLQSIHHLLPSVSCVHYPAMYPKFLAICEKHGCVLRPGGWLSTPSPSTGTTCTGSASARRAAAARRLARSAERRVRAIFVRR